MARRLSKTQTVDVASPPTPQIPEVRQCQDPESFMFGAIAVRSGVPGQKWSVMTVANGGHHTPDEDEVKDWVVASFPK